LHVGAGPFDSFAVLSCSGQATNLARAGLLWSGSTSEDARAYITSRHDTAFRDRE